MQSAHSVRDGEATRTNHHGEITIHSLSRPIPAADNTPSYRGVPQPTTTASIKSSPVSYHSATTAIRSTPKLVYHHPRRAQNPPQSKTYTTSYPRSLTHSKPQPQTHLNHIHYTSPTSLSLLSQLKSFLLLPQTTPDTTLLLNLLTKHHKVRLHLPRKNPWLAGWINKINWYGIHKHSSSAPLTKSQRWVLEHFVKSQKGLCEVGREGYDLFAIAERLGENKVREGIKRWLNREEQKGEIVIGMRVSSARYRPCKERYFPPTVNTARRGVGCF
ncbi:hypothetical protein QBC41DRAFT_305434 [Cercophora samala]|uniref:Uncharacterized protein n=1 Tax=Cercophora samala TaxID=330535 RepID=A0AA40DAE0_9PEZI|nr:hypothetical protein QBC41DRAFT_305434 [Cercophora samala]